MNVKIGSLPSKLLLLSKILLRIIKLMEKMFLIAVGIVGLYFSGRFLIDPEYAKKYVLENPKAYLWKKISGADKTMTMTKYVFAPIGIALSLLLIALGLLR